MEACNSEHLRRHHYGEEVSDLLLRQRVRLSGTDQLAQQDSS